MSVRVCLLLPARNGPMAATDSRPEPGPGQSPRFVRTGATTDTTSYNNILPRHASKPPTTQQPNESDNPIVRTASVPWQWEPAWARPTRRCPQRTRTAPAGGPSIGASWSGSQAWAERTTGVVSPPVPWSRGSGVEKLKTCTGVNACRPWHSRTSRVSIRNVGRAMRRRPTDTRSGNPCDGGSR